MRQTLHALAGGEASDRAAHGFHTASAEPALFRLDLGRSLHLHRRLAMGFALAGLIAAIVYVLFSWRIYTAQSLVFIQPTPARVLEGAAPMHWPYNYDPATYDSYLQQQLLSMTREDVLAGAVRKLGRAWQQSGESEQSAAARLKGAVEAARVGTSYQVAIAAHASSPDMAAALANAVANSYIENTSHEQKASDAARLAMLTDERDRVKKELDSDRAEQAALNAQLGVAGIGPVTPEHYDEDIARIHEELVKARADHDEAAARLTAMNAKNGGTSPALDAQADQLIATDAGLASLKTSLQQRRAALVSQMANLTPNHPQYQQDQAELAKIDSSIESSSGELRAKAAIRIEQQLRTDLDRTSELEARLNGQLAQITRSAAGATPKLQRASDLASDIARLQNRYAAVDEQLQNLLLEDSAPGTAHLAAAAVAPLHPAIAGVARNAMAILVFFVLLGLAAAVAAHKMDPRIYAASDVENLLGYPPMAQLPDFYEVPEEIAGEHLLRLAAGLEYAAKEAGVKKCVLTGAGPGVGVTTLALRLKEALGTLGRSAVVVSAGSEAMATLETQEEGNARDSLMLADTAPLTVSAETEYLARFADCTIVVIESGVTTRAQLRATASRLQRLNVPTVGFVLNRVGLSRADAAFRHAVREMQNHFRAQGRLQAQETPHSRAIFAEPAGNAKLQKPAVQLPPVEKPAEPIVAPKPTAAKHVDPIPAPAAEPAIQSPPSAAATVPPPAVPSLEKKRPQPDLARHQDLPWWLAEPTAHLPDPIAQPGKSAVNLAEPALERGESQPRTAAPEPAAPSPLDGLRDLFVSYRVKEPDAAKIAGTVNSGVSPAAAVPARDAAALPGRKLAAPPEVKQSSPAEPDRMARKEPPRQVTAAPEILPPKPLEATLRDEIDDVRTLPSRRGQYKKVG
jgi:uncharacterized protein involved in exopolysaccharide biosynthesis